MQASDIITALTGIKFDDATRSFIDKRLVDRTEAKVEAPAPRPKVETITLIEETPTEAPKPKEKLGQRSTGSRNGTNREADILLRNSRKMATIEIATRLGISAQEVYDTLKKNGRTSYKLPNVRAEQASDWRRRFFAVDGDDREKVVQEISSETFYRPSVVKRHIMGVT